jgi:hypothetical protein
MTQFPGFPFPPLFHGMELRQLAGEGDGHCVWSAAGAILSKQLRRAHKWWPTSFAFGRLADNYLCRLTLSERGDGRRCQERTRPRENILRIQEHKLLTSETFRSHYRTKFVLLILS